MGNREERLRQAAEEIQKLIPPLEGEDIDITQEEAIEAAEGYVYEE